MNNSRDLFSTFVLFLKWKKMIGKKALALQIEFKIDAIR